MSAYILIVVTFANIRSATISGQWPNVTMQRFADARACQFASVELKKLAILDLRMVCVPESAAPVPAPKGE